MLEAVLEYLKNWFERDPVTRMRRVYSGRLTASGGALSGVPEGFAVPGQRVRVRGSRLNDGLHDWPCSDLADEVAAWCAEHGDAQNSPYASESFGGYSYTKATASGSQAGSGGSTWQSVFAARLAPWRKL